MILESEVLKLHELSVHKFGGSAGVRDEGLLDSAIARPFQTFDGSDLYASVIEKAAAIIESITINHPFIDGNQENRIFGNVSHIEIRWNEFNRKRRKCLSICNFHLYR